ncbi:unnamed protein product [Thelazia callipaeda]|uniref:Transposase n=1 Tax=Thelazia callipaeda TaxID=103827 RepID=A0A158RAP8_THECL|nr:unnamed protein product [Thelazia callipaeda]
MEIITGGKLFGASCFILDDHQNFQEHIAKNNDWRVRRYDVMLTKQNVSVQAVSDDSDDELFGPLVGDDSSRRLVPDNSTQ